MKKAAVVILNWNGQKLLEQFLPSVVKYSERNDTEIIIADNCSTDGSVDFVASAYPHIRTIPLAENYGYAGGYNKALSEVEAEYLVLLNSDVEVTPGWLEPIIDYLDNNAGVAALQPKILSFNNKEQFEYAGAAGGFIDKYGYPFCRGRLFGVLEKDTGQYDLPVPVFWASGACMVIRQKDFYDAGGFDASFFAHMEEIDLCWRLNARGRKIVCLPHSVVYHLGGATLATGNSRKTFLNFRNNLLMLYKNLPDKELKLVLRIRLILDYLAVIQLVLAGKIQNAKAILAAHREFKKIIPNYRDARKENILKTKQNSIATIYPHSLLAAFYLRRRKRYDKLEF
ncbi:glycosyltransferase family 2 protein [Viscerimonas tarda]